MESPPTSPGHGDAPLDSSRPLRGVVICCTNIPADQRDGLARRTVELGGEHKPDLTPNVTHLIVGDYDTAKYRHVAKDRPDIQVMAVGWVDAVLDLWRNDAAIDFRALENEWRLLPFQTGGGERSREGGEPTARGKLLCCLTGFDDTDERQGIIDKITINGGSYTGDLTRKVTHLIVCKPEGRKYAAARAWNIHTVALEWLLDSAARGLILDESKYDPTLPPEERGKDAWNKRDSRRTSLGKRTRELAPVAQEDGRRKLRKTASMKLTSQRENIWGDILGNQPATESGLGEHAQEIQQPDSLAPSLSRFSEQQTISGATGSLAHKPTTDNRGSDGIFSACFFYVHGFRPAQAEILINTVVSLGGRLASSVEDIGSEQHAMFFDERMVIVPQDFPQEKLPNIPDVVHIVTEFYIEKCLHKKQFFHPTSHVMGRPFPLFPIPGFERLNICTGGFTGVDLNQMDKTVRQLGAKYEERFTNTTSLLLVPALDTVRKQKLDLAVAWKVPVVDVRWLWESISMGFKVPIQGFLYPELDQSVTSDRDTQSTNSKQPLQRSRSEPSRKISKPSDSAPSTALGTGTEVPPAAPAREPVKEDSNVTTNFETAPTHQSESRGSSRQSAPLSEVSNSELNKAPSPKKAPPQSRKPLSRVVSEVADSETAGDELTQETDEPLEEQQPEKSRRDRTARDKTTAERQALSSKLTTLLGATAHGAGTSMESIPAGDDEPPLAKPRGRRRGIMGRAVSNISAASSGSAESSTGRGKTASAAASFSVGPRVSGGTPSPEGGQAAPSTQLEYEDPNAQRYKAQLMKKMMGTECDDRSTAPLVEDKVTLKDFQDGVEAERIAAGRRTTRRR